MYRALAAAAILLTAAAAAIFWPSHQHKPATAVTAAYITAPRHGTAPAYPAPTAPARPRYTIRPGNTLTGIALRHCPQPSDWTGLYVSNRHELGGNPDLIPAGVTIVLDCYDPPGIAGLAARDDAPRPAPAPAAVTAPAPQAGAAAATWSGGTAFQQCVIARESGGNSQVMNSSSHYGLYQFSASTWAAYGGSPADFGHASVAEQNQVFDNAMATPGGAGNWSGYDGCL